MRTIEHVIQGQSGSEGKGLSLWCSVSACSLERWVEEYIPPCRLLSEEKGRACPSPESAVMLPGKKLATI